jgi:hypothetical protein
MTRGVLRRALHVGVCLLAMALCISGPLDLREATERYQEAFTGGREVQAAVVDVGTRAPDLPLQPASSYHVVAFELDGVTRTARLAGVPRYETGPVPVLVGPGDAVSSRVAMQAERSEALPRTLVFIGGLPGLLHLLVVDAVRWWARRRRPAGQVFELDLARRARRAA